MAPAEADGPEDADLGRPLPDAAHHGHQDHKPSHKNDHRRDGVGELPEMGQSLHPAFDDLLDGHHPGSRQDLRYLFDHVLDGAGRTERGHLDHGDPAFHLQDFLGRVQPGEDKIVILGAGGGQHPGDSELPSLGRKRIAPGQAQGTGRFRTEYDLVGFRRLDLGRLIFRLALESPPRFEQSRLLEVDPGQKSSLLSDLDDAQGHRAHRGNVSRVFDGPDGGQVRFEYLVHLERDAADIKALVSQGQVFGSRHD